MTPNRRSTKKARVLGQPRCCFVAPAAESCRKWASWGAARGRGRLVVSRDQALEIDELLNVGSDYVFQVPRVRMTAVWSNSAATSRLPGVAGSGLTLTSGRGRSRFPGAIGPDPRTSTSSSSTKSMVVPAMPTPKKALGAGSPQAFRQKAPLLGTTAQSGLLNIPS